MFQVLLCMNFAGWSLDWSWK